MKWQPLLSFTWFLILLLASLWLTWLVLAQLDFLYPLFYHWLGIDQTIATYGPRNRFKEGFELTQAQTHFALFSQIVTAIHQQGQGLSALSYAYQGIDRPLLRTPEILHLQDVAQLVDYFRVLGWFAVSLTFVLFSWHIAKRRVLPRLKDAFIIWFSLGLGLVIWLLVAGFKGVFYQLHIWIFPPEHPWFFYYQDSLMSTLMQAPTLFGAIGLVWIGLAILLTGGLHVGLAHLSNKLNPHIK